MWMLLQQKQNDRIHFFDNDSEEKNSLLYSKFIKHLEISPIINRGDFFKAIDDFAIIFLDMDTGEWSIRKNSSDCTSLSFSELCEANDVDFKSTCEIELEESTKPKFDILVEKAKEKLNVIHTFQRNKSKIGRK